MKLADTAVVPIWC